MNFNDYQEKAASVAIYPTDPEDIEIGNIAAYANALWAAAEIGEVCNKLKKVLRDDAGILTEEKQTEIGSLAVIANQASSWLVQSIESPNPEQEEHLNLNEVGLAYTSLGLAGEVGELCDKIKDRFDNNGQEESLNKDDMIGELGDILWYVANVAKELDISLDEVAEKNIEKLFSRKERGVIAGDGDNR